MMVRFSPGTGGISGSRMVGLEHTWFERSKRAMSLACEVSSYAWTEDLTSDSARMQAWEAVACLPASWPA